MNVEKRAYFYFKTEMDTNACYPDGYDGWYMDYFKENVHVIDNSGNDIIAEKESVYIVPPNTKMYFKYYNIPSFIHTCWLFGADEEFMNNLSVPFCTPIKIHNTGEFERLLYDMQERQVTKSKFAQHEQDLYLELILLFIHDNLHNYKRDYEVKSGEELQNLRNTMMNSLAFPWTIKNMANRVNMSTSTFQRKYKHLYGKTPVSDLYDMRFKKSKLLLETGYSIPWILNSCCFKSFQHFSRFFKEREGIPPSEYLHNIENSTKKSSRG